MNITSTFRRTALLGALATAGLLAATSAQATATAYFEVTGVTVTLFDLDGAGGTSPTITFDGGLSIADVQALSYPLTTFTGTWNVPPIFQFLGYQLGANTAVQFDVSYNMGATTQLVGDSSFIELGLATGDFSDPNGQWVIDTLDYKDASGANGSSQAFSGNFVGGTLNFGSGSLYRTMVFAGQSFGESVTAVPEPGAYAMFLAGLAVMGATARRRRAK